MRRRLVSVLIAAVSLAACSARTPHPSASGTPSTSISPTPTASGSKKPTHVPSARFAVYDFRGSIWLYDARANKTREIAHGGDISRPKWIDANDVSFVQSSGSSASLQRINLKTQEITEIFSVDTGIQAYGWSPDRQTVAYITTDPESYPHLRFRSISDGTTQSVATLARALGRGTSQGDEARIEFSKNGDYVLVVYTPADGTPGLSIPPEQSQFQVRSAGGALAYADSMARQPTMGLWTPAGTKVVFHDSSGVRTWTAKDNSTRTLRGLSWYDPWISQDGRLVAFDNGWESSAVRVRTLDLSTLNVQTVSRAGRAFPVFADAKTVWAQQIKACNGGCETPAEPADHVFAIDLRSGAERALAIQSLQDVDVLYQ